MKMLLRLALQNLDMRQNGTYQEFISDKVFGADEFRIITGFGSGVHWGLVAGKVWEVVLQFGFGCLHFLRQ